MQVKNAGRKRENSEKASVQNLVPIDIDGDDDDADAEEDEETQEFLSHVDELFSLEPAEFEKRMKATDKREAAARRPAKRRTSADDEDEDYDEDEDDEESDRVTEKISKKKLLQALNELNPTKTRKNLEGMPMARTATSKSDALPVLSVLAVVIRQCDLPLCAAAIGTQRRSSQRRWRRTPRRTTRRRPRTARRASS